MNIQLISDIHLELIKEPNTIISNIIGDDTKNSILILAGDIGNPSSKKYKKFIQLMSEKYIKVFVITGNHEYYQKYDTGKYRYNIEEIDKMINTLTSSLPNVHFLQRESFIYDRVRFLGCTLWSDCDSELSKYMNDYTYIKDFTPEISKNIHNVDVEWLRRELSLDKCGYDSTVVITHHLPTYKLINKKFENHPLNSFFVSNLDQIVEKADLWVCGHSHTSNYASIGKCKCYINPVGYQNESSGYDRKLTIDLMHTL